MALLTDFLRGNQNQGTTVYPTQNTANLPTIQNYGAGSTQASLSPVTAAAINTAQTDTTRYITRSPATQTIMDMMSVYQGMAERQQLAMRTNMADIVSWSGHGGINFFVKPTQVKGVTEIQIKASAETEDQEIDGEKYVIRKSAGSFEITMKAILNSMLGVNVEEETMKILEAARNGDDGYFYIAGKKLLTPMFMMTEANAEEVLLTGNGSWASCTVTMTLKQCSKYDGTTWSTAAAEDDSGGGGGESAEERHENLHKTVRESADYKTVEQIVETNGYMDKVKAEIKAANTVISITNKAKDVAAKIAEVLNNSNSSKEKTTYLRNQQSMEYD